MSATSTASASAKTIHRAAVLSAAIAALGLIAGCGSLLQQRFVVHLRRPPNRQPPRRPLNLNLNLRVGGRQDHANGRLLTIEAKQAKRRTEETTRPR